MKHDIQARIYEATKDMTREERRDYTEKKAAAFRMRMAKGKEESGTMTLREEPPDFEKKN